MNKINRLLTCLSWLTVSSTTAALAEINPPPSSVITVGVQTTLTGDVAGAGNDVRNSLEFANQKFTNGRYRFVFEDDGCTAKGGVSVATRFTSVEKLPYVIGVACNEPLLAAAPIYQKSGTVVLSTFATTGDQHDVGDHIFRLFPSDERAAAALYKYVAARHNRVAVYTEENEYSVMMGRTFTKLNNESSKPIELITESWLPQHYDHRSILLRFISKNPDAIFVNSNGELGYIEVVKQLRALKFKGAIYSAYWAASETSIAALGALNDGVITVNAPLLESILTDDGKQIYAEYLAKYGKPASIELGVATAIDALRILDAAIKSGRPVDHFLRTEKLSGLLTPVEFDQFGANVGVNFKIYKMMSGKAEIIK